MTLDCPLDCPYLLEIPQARSPRAANLRKFPNQDIRLTETFLRDHEPLLIALGKGYWPRRYRRPARWREPERVREFRVAADFFPLIGVKPTLGRSSNGFWRRRYGADPAIVGSAITVERESYTVGSPLVKWPISRGHAIRLPDRRAIGLSPMKRLTIPTGRQVARRAGNWPAC